MSDIQEEKEQVRKIAKLRANIEQKIKSLEEELEGQKTLLSLIDSALVQQSFKRAEIQKPTQASKSTMLPFSYNPPFFTPLLITRIATGF